MNDLDDLYQEIIIDHSRNPRNFGQLSAPTYVHEGYNPLCGDKLTVYFQEADGLLKEACFEGTGCAISIASASLMIEILKGKSVKEAEVLFSHFLNLVKGNNGDYDDHRLGKLVSLKGVAEFPMRVKCATLCWHTALAALQEEVGISMSVE